MCGIIYNRKVKTINQEKLPAWTISGWERIFIMKEEIANYIEGLLVTGKPLTDSQVGVIAYWELVDFHNDANEPSRRCHKVLNKFLEVYSNEMFALV